MAGPTEKWGCVISTLRQIYSVDSSNGVVIAIAWGDTMHSCQSAAACTSYCIEVTTVSALSSYQPLQ